MLSKSFYYDKFPRRRCPDLFQVRRIIYWYFSRYLNHLDIEGKVSTIKVSLGSLSANPSVSQVTALKNVYEIARTASDHRAIVVSPLTGWSSRTASVDGRANLTLKKIVHQILHESRIQAIRAQFSKLFPDHAERFRNNSESSVIFKLSTSYSRGSCNFYQSVLHIR